MESTFPPRQPNLPESGYGKGLGKFGVTPKVAFLRSKWPKYVLFEHIVKSVVGTFWGVFTLKLDSTNGVENFCTFGVPKRGTNVEE